jgi:hypothetical protein
MAHGTSSHRNADSESKRTGGIEVSSRDVSKRQMFLTFADASRLPLTNSLP